MTTPLYNSQVYQDNARFQILYGAEDVLSSALTVDSVNLTLYNAIGDKIDFDKNIKTWIYKSKSENKAELLIDVHQDVRNLGFITGKYSVLYNFYKDIIGNPDALPCNIHAFSTNRDEVRVIVDDPRFINKFLQLQSSDKIPFLPGLSLIFESGATYNVIDFTVDDITFPQSPFSIIFKIDGTFDSDILFSSSFRVAQRLISPLQETIILIPPVDEDDSIYIKGPNFDALSRFNYNDSSGFKAWDDILLSSASTTPQLLTELISGSAINPLQIDHRSFENFIHFSSVKERLVNFRYKLGLIELYDDKIKSYSTRLSGLISGSITGSVIYTDNVETLSAKRRAVFDGFDHYEQYLYFKSSSYESSSFGEFYPTTWPKQNNVNPYINYSVTSSQGIEWFNGIIASASVFDKNNIHALTRQLPGYVLEDDSKANALLFTNMIGHHFDAIFNSINSRSKLYHRDYDANFALPKQMLIDAVHSLGIQLNSTTKTQELWNYLLGMDANYTVSSSLSYEQQNIQLHNKILNSLPFLLQTKGTTRGLKALLHTYGIPNSILKIKEFSGPIYNSTAYNILPKENWYFIADNRLGHNQSFHVNVTVPYETLSVRFRMLPLTSQSYSSAPLIQYQRPTNVSASIGIQYVSGSEGIISSDAGNLSGPFFNGEWWTLVLEQSQAKMHVINAYKGRVIHHLTSSGLIKVPGGTGQHSFGDPIGVTGGFIHYQNIQVRESALSESVMHKIAIQPDFVGGNTDTDSLTDVIAYFPLGTSGIFGPFRSGSSTIMDNQSHYIRANISGSFYISSGSLSSGSEYEEFYRLWPNGLQNRFVNEKIHIVSNSLSNNTVDLTNRLETRTYDDRIEYDTNRLGVYFSPTDEINELLTSWLGHIDISNYIGDPRDEYENSYKYGGLSALKSAYFNVYKNRYNTWDYLRVISFLDSSLFHLIKQFVPARANILTGVVIEPHVLEITKTKHNLLQSPLITSEDANVDLNNTVDITGEDISYNSVVSTLVTMSSSGDVNVLHSNVPLDDVVLIDGETAYYENSISAVSSLSSSAEDLSIEANTINTRLVSAGTYNLNNGSRYRINTSYQHFPVTFSGFFSNTNGAGGWNDPTLAALTSREIKQIKVNGRVYDVDEDDMVSIFTPSSTSGDAVALAAAIDIGYGALIWYGTTNNSLYCSAGTYNSIDYIVVRYADLSSESVWYPTNSSIEVPVTPYWYSDAIMPIITESRLSNRRMIREYFYSSSYQLINGDAYSSSLRPASVCDFNLDNYRMKKIKFIGTQLRGAGINIPSTESIDGKAVVEVITVDANQLRPIPNNQTNKGNLNIE